MFLVTAIVSVVLAAALAMSAGAKLTRKADVIASMHTVEVPDDKIPLLAYVEIAGAVGLIVGLFWWPIGVLAALGVIAYFVGAVGAHLRVSDRQIAPAAVLLIVAFVTLVVRIASA
ncbi:DoxX family protein [Antrihabitans cavernicola]|uniref:DoxX family protein n=1 Tax=Antrihabitans cavernicola TaxID=2495913 RepID=A0A5A7S9Y8_9NOCA|nr:DoxX family protein [Spelaeibacter cavernicola]KAA0022726.1 DoxX family protein [Spelaeibacter cavernicola]